MIRQQALTMAWVLKHQIESGFPLELKMLDSLVEALGGSPSVLATMNPEQKMFYALVLVVGAS